MGQKAVIMRAGSVRQRVLWVLTEFMIRLRGHRPDPDDANRRRKQMDYETNTSRLGLRMTESLRDRLRRKWIKIRKD